MRRCLAVCKRLLPCFCSLTAGFFSSFSLIVFFFFSRASAKSKTRPAFCTSPIAPLLWTVTVPPPDISSCADPCLRAIAQSFIHSRLLLRAVLFGSVRSSSDCKNQEVLLSPYSFYNTDHLNTLNASEKSAVLRIIFKANSSGTKEERGDNLIFYFTHHQDSRNALWCFE